jgi:hypothetical protein
MKRRSSSVPQFFSSVMCLRRRQFAELCCDAHKPLVGCEQLDLVMPSSSMARPRVRKNSDAARRAASRQTRDEADECCACACATSSSQVGTLYGSDEHTGVLPSGVFRARLCDEIRREAARRRATAPGRAAPRRSGLRRFRAPRCARRAVPRAQSRAPTRRCAAAQSGCETRAAAASAARRGATATTLVTTSVRSVPSSASTCASDMPYCTSSAAVCRAISARWVVVALPFEHRRHDARQLVDKRRREHRVGERDDEQQLKRLRLRGGALDNAPHELAALPRRGVTATRRPVETRTCEKRSSAWLSMPRCKIAAMRAHHDAPRQPSMCTSVDARSSARACALALPTAGACTESPSHSRCSASASHATRRASTRFATKRSAAAISTPRSSPSPLLKPSTQC